MRSYHLNQYTDRNEYCREEVAICLLSVFLDSKNKDYDFSTAADAESAVFCSYA